MAEIRNVAPRAAQSNFRRATPQAGVAMFALGEMAQQAANFLQPGAIAEQKKLGAEETREALGSRARAPNTQTQISTRTDGSNWVGGVSRDYLKTIRKTESSNNDQAKNKRSTATGRYQFIESTWRELMAENPELGLTLDGRTDGDQQELAIVPFTAKNARSLQKAGIEPTKGYLYAAHFLGAGGAKRVLKANDNAQISSLVKPDVMTANPFLAGMNVGRFKRWVNKKGGGVNLGFVEGRESDAVDVSSITGQQSGFDQQVSTMEAPENFDQQAMVAPETTIRSDEGKIEARLYSPMSGPILQAYNAAAGVAYVSEMSNRGLEDMMQMSRQHRSNPETFMEMAEEYVQTAVDDAPEQFQEDIRRTLDAEKQRRYLGLVDSRNRETDMRANNSSKALMDRYAQDFSEALAAGMQEDADVALRQLEGVLFARESLPGVAWTKEQSENLISDAARAADRIRAAGQKEQAAQWKTEFQTIASAAKDGRTSEFDALLENEAAVAAHPELARKAAAMVTVRDNMPAFMIATPAQQLELIEKERARPMGATWEGDVLDAMETAHKATVSALDEDSIQFGMDHLPNAPQPLDLSLAATNEQAFLDQMEDRVEFAYDMVSDGYVGQPAFLSNEEAATLGALLGGDADPEIRATLAAALVSGFGADAGAVLRETGADPVTVFGGQLMAAGGPQMKNTFMQALMGQQLLNDNQVRLPNNASQLSRFAPDAVVAMQGLSNGIEAQGQTMEFAKSLYASRAQGIEPNSDDAKALMEEVTQQALGQVTNPRNGKVTGGVQQILGHPVLLPIGVSGENLEAEIQKTLIQSSLNDGSFIGNVTAGIYPRWEYSVDVNKWQSASPNRDVPMFGGEPMSYDIFDDERVRVVAAGGNLYRMEVVTGNTVRDIETEQGNIFFFDMAQFMGAQ